MSGTIIPASSNFNLVIPYVLANEGGYSNVYGDPGNWTGGSVGVGTLKGTNFGIAASEYPNLDIPNLTQAQAEQIYYNDYWLPIGGDNMPLAMAFLLLDAYVNSGGNGIKWVQALLGLNQDGDCGQMTQGAVKNYTNQKQLCLLYSEAHSAFYIGLNTFNEFGKGWLNRVITNSFTAQTLLDQAQG
jgi:lysozyme family protein